MKKTAAIHTSNTHKLRGNVQGVGVRNPMGKMRDPNALSTKIKKKRPQVG